MSVILNKLYQGYKFLDQHADRRVDNYFLLGNPLTVLIPGILYLYFCLNWGVKWMKNRPAYSLKYPIILFNLGQVLVNAYLFVEMLQCFIKLRSYCAEIDYSRDETSLRILNACYIYFITKQLDLLDTIFFVLRKKQNQISFLHIYHHFGMAMGSWVGLKFWAGGASGTIVLVNSLVHSVMYVYYLLTIYDPKYKTSLWWKKHITHLQLVQFLFFILYYGGLFVMPNCNYPKIIPFIFVPQNCFISVLFGDFYYKTYIKNKKKDQ